MGESVSQLQRPLNLATLSYTGLFSRLFAWADRPMENGPGIGYHPVSLPGSLSVRGQSGGAGDVPGWEEEPCQLIRRMIVSCADRVSWICWSVR